MGHSNSARSHAPDAYSAQKAGKRTSALIPAGRHSDVFALIDEPEDDLPTLLEQLAIADAPNDIVALLRKLDRKLTARFAEEEGVEGLHVFIGRRAPRLYPRIDRRRAEHRTILERLERLLSIMSPTILRRRASELVLDIHVHEARELDMVQDAVTTELGGGD